VTEDAIATFEPRRSGLPTSFESIAEQLICSRLMHPYGDRRDGSKSSSIETQEVGAKWQYDIVRVLILSDDLRDLDARRLRRTPAQQVGQRVTARERVRDISKD